MLIFNLFGAFFPENPRERICSHNNIVTLKFAVIANVKLKKNLYFISFDSTPRKQDLPFHCFVQDFSNFRHVVLWWLVRFDIEVCLFCVLTSKAHSSASAVHKTLASRDGFESGRLTTDRKLSQTMADIYGLLSTFSVRGSLPSAVRDKKHAPNMIPFRDLLSSGAVNICAWRAEVPSIQLSML